MYFGKIFASWETQRLNSEEPMHTYIHGRYKDDVDKEVNIETELQLKKI
jgi:hypothetical protein